MLVADGNILHSKACEGFLIPTGTKSILIILLNIFGVLGILGSTGVRQCWVCDPSLGGSILEETCGRTVFTLHEMSLHTAFSSAVLVAGGTVVHVAFVCGEVECGKYTGGGYLNSEDRKSIAK